MNWLTMAVHGTSGLFLLVAGLLFFLYAREFYIRGVPAEWSMVAVGFILFGIGTGIVPFVGSMVAIGVQALGGAVLCLGFGTAYWRSTGGFF